MLDLPQLRKDNSAAYGKYLTWFGYVLRGKELLPITLSGNPQTKKSTDDLPDLNWYHFGLTRRYIFLKFKWSLGISSTTFKKRTAEKNMGKQFEASWWEDAWH